jgi:hypothetical protein
VSREGKTLDPKKIKALVKILVPKTLQEIQVFNGMVQFYKYFIKNFAFIMAPITKLLRKVKVFEWTTKCQTTWEDIKNRYIQSPIFINPNWELEFHIHTYASQIAARAILAQNPIGKIDQLIMYSLRLLNYVEKNYTTIESLGSSYGLCLTQILALHVKQQVYFLNGPYGFNVFGQQATDF